MTFTDPQPPHRGSRPQPDCPCRTGRPCDRHIDRPGPLSPERVNELITATLIGTDIDRPELYRRAGELRELGQLRALQLAVEQWVLARAKVKALTMPSGNGIDPFLMAQVSGEYERACDALAGQWASVETGAPQDIGHDCTCHYIHGGVRVPELSCPVHFAPPPVSAITTEIPAVPPAHRTRQRLPLRGAIVAGLLLFALVLNLTGGRIG